MRAVAIPMILLMLSASLAGCTSGDPDGDGTSGIDMEILNQMIDDNLQDFINNTSVTINQEIHYHNNTTNNVDSSDNSVSNYNGTSGVSSSQMHVFVVEWDPTEHYEPLGFGDRIVSVTNGNLQISTGNNELLFAFVYNGYIIEFEDVTCEQVVNYYQLGSQEWRYYLDHEYGYDGETIYERSYELDDFWSDFYWGSNGYSNLVDSSGKSIREQCGFSSSSAYIEHTLFTIELEQGEAIQFNSVGTGYLDIEMDCIDNFPNSNLSLSGTYYGGHVDCDVSGIAKIYGQHRYNHTYWVDAGNNSSSSILPLGAPTWWPSITWNIWYNYEETRDQIYSNTQSSFSVYFTLLDVEPYSFE